MGVAQTANMDYEALAACLLRRVRGTMSSRRLSGRLGFSSNVLQLWERHERLPYLACSRLQQLRWSLARSAAVEPLTPKF